MFSLRGDKQHPETETSTQTPNSSIPKLPRAPGTLRKHFEIQSGFVSWRPIHEFYFLVRLFFTAVFGVSDSIPNEFNSPHKSSDMDVISD